MKAVRFWKCCFDLVFNLHEKLFLFKIWSIFVNSLEWKKILERKAGVLFLQVFENSHALCAKQVEEMSGKVKKPVKTLHTPFVLIFFPSKNIKSNYPKSYWQLSGSIFSSFCLEWKLCSLTIIGLYKIMVKFLHSFSLLKRCFSCEIWLHCYILINAHTLWKR